MKIAELKFCSDSHRLVYKLPNTKRVISYLNSYKIFPKLHHGVNRIIPPSYSQLAVRQGNFQAVIRVCHLKQNKSFYEYTIFITKRNPAAKGSAQKIAKNQIDLALAT